MAVLKTSDFPTSICQDIHFEPQCNYHIRAPPEHHITYLMLASIVTFDVLGDHYEGVVPDWTAYDGDTLAPSLTAK